MDASRSQGEGAGEKSPRSIGFGAVNYVTLVVGVVVVLLGYALLDRGSVIAAPLLLVAGYFVLVPAGLLLGFRRRDRSE